MLELIREVIKGIIYMIIAFPLMIILIFIVLAIVTDG